MICLSTNASPTLFDLSCFSTALSWRVGSRHRKQPHIWAEEENRTPIWALARPCNSRYTTSANSWSFFAPSWNRTSVMGFSKTQVLGSPCVTATLQAQYLLHVYSTYLLNIPTHLFTQSPLATAFTQNTLSRPSRDLVFKAFAFDISWLTHSTPWWPFNQLPIYLSIYLSRASDGIRTHNLLITNQLHSQSCSRGV